MIKIYYNAKVFTQTQSGFYEDYEFEDTVEFITSDKNYIEYDNEQDLMDFYLNIDNHFYDDLCEFFDSEEHSEYERDLIISPKDIVEYYFAIKEIR